MLENEQIKSYNIDRYLRKYKKGVSKMNITSLGSTNISLSDTGSMDAIDISMLKKTLDTVEINGNMLTKMMEQSVNPNIGANIDLRL